MMDDLQEKLLALPDDMQPSMVNGYPYDENLH